MLLYWLVCETELCFEQISDSEKFYCNIIGFSFLVSLTKIILFPITVNQVVRNPVREFVLSNGTSSIAKSVSCRITSVKKVCCNKYYAIAVHNGPVIIIQKTEYQAAVHQYIFTVRMFMV